MSLIAASSRIRVYFVGWHCIGGLLIISSYVSYMFFVSYAFGIPDCPTYALLHVLHFSLYIPLGLVLLCCLDNCCCKVLVALNAIFKSVCLNRFVIVLSLGYSS